MKHYCMKCNLQIMYMWNWWQIFTYKNYFIMKFKYELKNFNVKKFAKKNHIIELN